MIREAHPQDLEGIYAIFSLADALHREAHPEIFQVTTQISSIKSYLLDAILADDGVIFVGEVQGEVIGAIIAWVRQPADYPILKKRNFVSVDNLVVAVDYREMGVGKALMEKIHLWAQNRQIKEIQLTVWDFNAEAIAFYEKLGYHALHHRLRKELL